MKALLDKAASEPTFRQVLEDEAVRLTKVGKDFMIRHTEVGKVPVEASLQIDYLFERLFSLVQLLLKASGRGPGSPSSLFTIQKRPDDPHQDPAPS